MKSNLTMLHQTWNKYPANIEVVKLAFKGLKRLEPYAGKLACTVLRGGTAGNCWSPTRPDKESARALAAAAGRGVMVKVLLDRSNRKDERSAKSILLDQKIPLRFDAPNGIAHNKIMIIDAAKVISGSYNFSAAAYKRNTENLLIIHNAPLAKDYIQNWQGRWDVSK